MEDYHYDDKESKFYDCCMSSKDKEFIYNKFKTLLSQEQFDYNDNYRLALQGDRRSIHRYNLIKNNGCCGFHDERFKAPSGKTYLVGFNYGH